MSSASKPRRSADEESRLATALHDIFEQRMPFNEILGLRVESTESASPALAFAMRPELVGTGQHGRLHGGVIAAALDTAGALALAVALGEEHIDESTEQIVQRFNRCGTIDLRVDYLHPGIGRTFRASARLVRLGGRIATVQMELRNDADLLIATGAASLIVN